MHDFNVYLVHTRDQLNDAIEELTKFADSTGSKLLVYCMYSY